MREIAGVKRAVDCLLATCSAGVRSAPRLQNALFRSCCGTAASGLRMPPKRNSAAPSGPDGLAEAPPHFHGHRERLRSRFMEAGPEALADYEMLELVLFRAVPRRDVKPLAKDLLARFGSFAEVISASPARLAEVDGLGEAAITEFKVVQAAAHRLVKGQVQKRPVLSSWSSVLDYVRAA